MTLPRHIDPLELVPDLANRQGVWLNPATDEVFALPHDWNPHGLAKTVPPHTRQAVVVQTPPAPDYSKLTEGQLNKMNKAQMAVVATALGIEGFDEMTKAETTALILATIKPQASTAGETASENADDPWNSDLTGRDVFVLTGPHEGKIGVVSETGGEDDDFAVRVILDGNEVTFATFEPQLRFLTPEESAAAKDAAKDASV